MHFCRKSIKKFQVSLKSDKNNGHFYEDVFTFMTISRWFILRMINVSDKICRENQNTFCVQYPFFRKSCRLWNNVEKYGGTRKGTDDNRIRRIALHATQVKQQARTHAQTDAHALTHAHVPTNRHSRERTWKCVVFIAFPRQPTIVSPAHFNIAFYAHLLFLFLFSPLSRFFFHWCLFFVQNVSVIFVIPSELCW
jgi:hypothetical protein